MRTSKMLNPTKSDLTLPIPLTLKAHRTAETFYQQHSDPQKAKQVYLNTLAIDAVHSYLSWLGVLTDRQSSDSWNPFVQALADVADLEIPGQGKLECRPVLPGATACQVPPEVWSDRMGYVVVQMDEDLKAATLLGFVPHVDQEELLLSQLQPIETLLDHLSSQEQHQPQTLVFLSQWLQGLFTQGWMTATELLDPQPKLSFRSLTLPVSEEIFALTTGGKVLDLMPQVGEQQIGEQQVVLLLGMMTENIAQVTIWVKLCPPKHSLYLPENLEIRVLDEQGITVMQAQSRQTEMLQLKFQGMVGERFSLDIRLNGMSVVETFAI
jgi:Protein of unknown function (DUF1822)